MRSSRGERSLPRAASSAERIPANVADSRKELPCLEWLRKQARIDSTEGRWRLVESFEVVGHEDGRQRRARGMDSYQELKVAHVGHIDVRDQAIDLHQKAAVEQRRGGLEQAHAIVRGLHSISELAPLTRWFDPNAARYPLRKLFTTRRNSGEISLDSTRKPRRCTKSSIPRLVVSTTPSRVGAPRREISPSTALINRRPTPRRCHLSATTSMNSQRSWSWRWQRATPTIGDASPCDATATSANSRSRSGVTRWCASAGVRASSRVPPRL